LANSANHYATPPTEHVTDNSAALNLTFAIFSCQAYVLCDVSTCGATLTFFLLSLELEEISPNEPLQYVGIGIVRRLDVHILTDLLSPFLSKVPHPTPYHFSLSPLPSLTSLSSRKYKDLTRGCTDHLSNKFSPVAYL